MIKTRYLSPKERFTLYNKALRLKESGLGCRRIARILNISKSTTRCWLNGYQGKYSNPINAYHGRYTALTPSAELAYIIGALLGDGNLSARGYQIRLEAKDRDFVEKFSSCLTNVLNRDIPYPVWGPRSDGLYYTSGGSRHLFEFLKQGWKDDFVLVVERYPSDFLRGLFDSEGCVSLRRRFRNGQVFFDRCITLSNTDVNLLVRTKNLLKKFFDINSSICISSRPRHYKVCYRLGIYRCIDILKYARFVGFSIQRKAQSLQRMVRTIMGRRACKKLVAPT